MLPLAYHIFLHLGASEAYFHLLGGPLYVDAEFEGYGRFEYGDMVVHVHGQVVAAHHSEAVAVDVEHEGVEFDRGAVDYGLDLHVVDHVALLVAEEQPFAHGFERFGVEQHERVAFQADGGAQRGDFYVHLRAEVGGDGYVGVDYPGKIAHHWHERVDGRNDRGEAVQTEVAHFHSHAELQGIYGRAVVEAVEGYGAQVGTRREVAQVEGTVEEHHLAAQVMEDEVGVEHVGSAQRECGVDVVGEQQRACRGCIGHLVEASLGGVVVVGPYHGGVGLLAHGRSGEEGAHQLVDVDRVRLHREVHAQRIVAAADQGAAEV